MRKFSDCLRQVVGAGDLFSFTLVGKKNIDIWQDVQQIFAPLAFGIIVGVKRGRKALGFGFAKQINDFRAKGSVQEVRREMQMSRRKNVIEIEIDVAQLEHRSRIGQDESMFWLGEYDGQARGCLTGSERNMR